jgi:hypothetical protein
MDVKYSRKINNIDLLKNKYDIKIIEQNRKHLNKTILLCTQKLTVDFCIRYILDLDIESDSEDSYIYDINYILEKQPHITEQELDNAFLEYKKNK